MPLISSGGYISPSHSAAKAKISSILLEETFNLCHFSSKIFNKIYDNNKKKAFDD